MYVCVSVCMCACLCRVCHKEVPSPPNIYIYIYVYMYIHTVHKLEKKNTHTCVLIRNKKALFTIAKYKLRGLRTCWASGKSHHHFSRPLWMVQ